ncbi:MAG: UvrD-helicase domain-containing protein [Planctomycetaceae bacterium]
MTSEGITTGSAAPPRSADGPGTDRFVAVRASAGTGKTHALTTRVIALLADGTPPEEIFAATFARKAAGEILARVLRRIADAADPTQPAATTRLADELGAPGLGFEAFLAILATLTAALGRVAIGTLDAFFVSAADAARYELGLPEGWGVGGEAEIAGQRRRAIHAALADGEATAAALATLLVQASGGGTTRGLEDAVGGIVADLAALHRQADATAWEPLAVPPPPAASAVGTALATLRAATFTDQRIGTARDAGLEAFDAGRYRDFLAKGIAAKLVAGETTYYRKPIADDVVTAYGVLIAVARTAVIARIVEQTRAMREWLDRHAAALDRLVRRTGIVSFDDVTRLVGDAAADGTLDAARWRGIPFAKHLLLDEFQDTSLGQWRVLERLAEHTATSGGTFFAVGDAKQAIYGWRGGEATLFDALGGFFADGTVPLRSRALRENWRSSPAVLDAVNALFGALGTCPQLADAPEVVAEWNRSFQPHVAAARTLDLPGWVRLRTAPAGDGSTGDLFRTAADRARALSAANPGRTVAVLVRTNAGAEQVIARLRGAGVAASAEGGQPLSDSPAVELVLSVLSLVDHPSDTVARFHVGSSVLSGDFMLDGAGAVAASPPASFLAALERTRRRLIDDGYAAVLGDLATRIAPVAGTRDGRRLEQLLVMARDHDARHGGSDGLVRTAPFVARVRTERVADPEPAAIRVMTIHKSKGLEFDIVVLTDLDRKLVPHHPRVVIDRPAVRGRVLPPIRGLLTGINGEIAPLLPAPWPDCHRRASHPLLRESISTLYVGMTRAIQALEVIVAPAKPRAAAAPHTIAGILRATLGAGAPASPDTLLFSASHRADPADDRLPATSAQAAPPAAAVHGPVRLAPLPATGRRRGKPWRTPSGQEGGSAVAAAALLEAGSLAARGVGTLLHAWVEQVGWPAMLPDDATLARIARDHPLVAGQAATLAADFRAMCAVPAVAALLAEPVGHLPERLVLTGLPPGPAVPVLWRERGFALAFDDGLLQGIVDRLVEWRRDGRAVAAEVIDFKFDGMGDATKPADRARLLRDKTVFYAPQLEAYRAAVARVLAIPERHVATSLVFMRAGTVVPVG